MAIINSAALQSTFKAWSKTDGKDAITKAIQQASFSEMCSLTEELISLIKTTAASYDLPASVMQHFDSLAYNHTDMGNGMYEFNIYFQDDLSRESLEDGAYTGSGIGNIISLFNNGYAASAPKYGIWNGHAGNKRIKGTQSRASLRFMQKAIEEFENKYKTKYNLVVTLNESEYGT